MNAATGRIVVASLTAKDGNDGAEIGPLLNQVTTLAASFAADGAHDQDSVSVAIAERHPEPAVIVPPRSTAVPGMLPELPLR